MPRTIATTVAPRAMRAIRSGHPWVFDQSIRTQKPFPEPGDLAVIFDDKRRFAGIGLADPDSPIAIRMLHHGSPRTIDSAFFANRVDEALELRTQLTSSTQTNGYRLIHGENDRLPGLIVDQYAGVIVVKIYTKAWLPHLDPVVAHLVARRSPAAVVLRASRTVESALPHRGASVLHGDLPDPLVDFTENGLHFLADVIAGNKTGHFLDQRDNRQRIRERSENRSVLDVFSSTGAFSVYSAAGGARSITAIDIADRALATAAANVKANNLNPPGGFRTIRGDAFAELASLGTARERFDIVIVDPPSFAPKQSDIARALAAYRKLTRAAIEVLSPGGLLVQASCSARVSEEAFRAAILDELDRSQRTFARIESFGHPLDHPVGFPEGRYLKAIFARAT
ncbi:MAG: class I SAM-dependent rRNA methyltransferase [Acidimicrobiales bacterium]